jgi:hypothetical protein
MEEESAVLSVKERDVSVLRSGRGLEVTSKVGAYPWYTNKGSGRGFEFANQEVNRENVHP